MVNTYIYIYIYIVWYIYIYIHTCVYIYIYELIGRSWPPQEQHLEEMRSMQTLYSRLNGRIKHYIIIILCGRIKHYILAQPTPFSPYAFPRSSTWRRCGRCTSATRRRCEEYVFIYIYIYMYTYIHIHTYMYIYIYSSVYIYIHTYIERERKMRLWYTVW